MLELMIVDDVHEDLAFLERILRQCKILNPIHRFSAGSETLGFFRDQKPDARCLVFLDLIMSPVSGISVLKTLKAEGIGQNSVFIMLSGITDIKAVNEGYKLGAHTFLIKPIKPEDIMDLISSLRNRISVQETPEGYLLQFAGRNVPAPQSFPNTGDRQNIISSN